MLYLFQKPCMTSQIFVEVKKLYCGFIWLPSNLPIMIISPRKFKFYCLNSFTSSSHAFKPGCLLTILIRNIVNYSHDLPLYKPYRCLNCTLHYNCIHFNSALATFSHHIVERDNNFIWSIIPGQVLLLIPPIDGCCLIQLESLHTIILSLQNYIDCRKCKKLKKCNAAALQHSSSYQAIIVFLLKKRIYLWMTRSRTAEVRGGINNKKYLLMENFH